MPLFTWNPISGKQSYFVIIATDPNFQHVIDYAFTKIPAYAPRGGLGQWTTYPDTSSKYYWAVLPATQANGAGAVGDPVNSAAAQDFQKQSVAPTLITPASQATVTTQPAFQWSPVEGAYYYHLEVSTAAQFTCDQQSPGPSCLENVGTNSINALAESSYTSNTTYPAGQTLYWRVQAVDRAGNGLAWSATGQFTKTLPAPTFSGVTAPYNPTTSDSIPVWRWNPVPGAVSYDVQLNCSPTMSCTNGNNLDTTTAAPTLDSMTTDYTNGGTLYWHVAAKDADSNTGTFSAPLSFKLPLKIAVASNTSIMVHKTSKTVTVTTKDARNHAIAGVTVKV